MVVADKPYKRQHTGYTGGPTHCHYMDREMAGMRVRAKWKTEWIQNAPRDDDMFPNSCCQWQDMACIILLCCEWNAKPLAFYDIFIVMYFHFGINSSFFNLWIKEKYLHCITKAKYIYVYVYVYSIIIIFSSRHISSVTLSFLLSNMK